MLVSLTWGILTAAAVIGTWAYTWLNVDSKRLQIFISQTPMLAKPWQQWVYWISVALAFKLAVVADSVLQHSHWQLFGSGKGSRFLSSITWALYVAVWLGGSFQGTHKTVWVGIGFLLSFGSKFIGFLLYGKYGVGTAVAHGFAYTGGIVVVSWMAWTGWFEWKTVIVTLQHWVNNFWDNAFG